MILEQAAYHLNQLVEMYKQHKLLLQRLVASRHLLSDSEATAVAAQLGRIEHSLLEAFAVFGPEVEEYLHSVKDHEFCVAYAHYYLFRTRPALPVSLRFRYDSYVPGSVHDHGDLRAEAEFDRKVYGYERAIRQDLLAVESRLPPDAVAEARRAAIRHQGLRQFLGAAGTDYCPGLSFMS
jgi:hypothetical protein